MAQIQDPVKTQELVIELVKAFTANPQALVELLDNPAMSAALTDYIDAAAEALRPPSDWKEIYRICDESLERTFGDPQTDPLGRDFNFTGIPILVVKYHDRARVAVAYGTIGRKRHDEWLYQGFSVALPFNLEWCGFFDEAAQAVEWGQSLWPQVMAHFIANTRKIPDEAAPETKGNAISARLFLGEGNNFGVWMLYDCEADLLADSIVAHYKNLPEFKRFAYLQADERHYLVADMGFNLYQRIAILNRVPSTVRDLDVEAQADA